ncbi:putative wall-associated receptor kinase-like 16 [Zea mays]|uniref:putative wall-associated receptor kinase-like 16 n=1 Tax=Zea mays TaxID=4577 RepID=UPI0002215089|nr:putative wall-associated receptor kinase-like 16 [Zea mays]|eukprot:XP_008666480.1 putative wall-associated receptor kinase-like 16 [Zea mays]
MENPRNDGKCNHDGGCCPLDLPKGAKSIRAVFYLLNKTSPLWKNYPCNYVTVMDRTRFKFNTTYLTSSAFYDINNGEVSAVMEWKIEEKRCKDPKIHKHGSYACVSNNSECTNTSDDAGYACKCSKGYYGNPYLINGCKDINECEHQKDYPCYGVCRNLLGTFECHCKHGTKGNATVKGGCVKGSSAGLSIGLGVGSGICFVVLALISPYIMRKIKTRRIKERFFKQNHGLLLQQLISRNANISERMIITLREVEKATNNFDRERVIGGGGHGTVFKGNLDLNVVAIKKSKIVVQREINEFINEVVVLSQVNHRNVVKLLGCCLETEVPLLVYEFISNGTLYHHLHVHGPISLSWADRLRIALEVARALSYLHSAASMPIFHRDIKTTNILLDDNLTAKVSDFGASRYIKIDQTGVTTAIQGTIGYLDPMYYKTCRLTDKSDVFSFGVVLVELLTRRKPFCYQSDNGDDLVTHFTSLLIEGKLEDIIDPQIMEEEDGEILKVARLATLCTELRGEDRPPMREVEMTLENLILKKRQVLFNKSSWRYDTNQTRDSTRLNEFVSNEASRQYTMEEEILLSATYPR